MLVGCELCELYKCLQSQDNHSIISCLPAGLLCWTLTDIIRSITLHSSPSLSLTLTLSQCERSCFIFFQEYIYSKSAPIMLTRDQRGHMVSPYLEYRAAVYLSFLFWWSPGAVWDYYPAPGSFQSIKNCKQWPLVPVRPGTDYCKYHHCWLFSIITVRPCHLFLGKMGIIAISGQLSNYWLRWDGSQVKSHWAQQVLFLFHKT